MVAHLCVSYFEELQLSLIIGLSVIDYATADLTSKNESVGVTPFELS